MLIQAFEWEKLKVGQEGFTLAYFERLINWQSLQPDKYFEIGHRTIQFNNWVGVIQTGKLTIEVLPKASASRHSTEGDNRADSVIKWKKALVSMLVRGKLIKARSPDAMVNLQTEKMSLLEIIFLRFLEEVESLRHRGLVKKYSKRSSNNNALKGRLLISKNIQKNLVHKERFFSEFDRYDGDNVWNQIINTTLSVLTTLPNSSKLRAKAKELQYSFNDVSLNNFNQNDFDRLIYSRNTIHYKSSIELARLILLKMRPINLHGEREVVSLFYDMNKVWESWLLETLKLSYREDKRVKIIGKKSKCFWESKSSKIRKKLETDILVSIDGKNIVLDAKWKIPKKLTPDDGDIKQMFAYNKLWESDEAWLCYPETKTSKVIVGEFKDSQQSSLGMCFYNIFQDGRLVNRLKLPDIEGQ